MLYWFSGLSKKEIVAIFFGMVLGRIVGEALVMIAVRLLGIM